MRAPVSATNPFAQPLAPARARALPPVTVAAASTLTILPGIAHFPILPPLGLLVLLAWRLLAPGALRRWAPAALGFYDDLLSGQPLGSAVLLWSLAFFLVDLVDQRVLFRDFGLDWLIASAAIAMCLVGGRFLATPVGAPVDTMLLTQTVASILLFPLAARFCGWIDRKRGDA